MSVIALTSGTDQVRRLARAYLAAKDFADGLRQSWLWAALAQQDIRLRYRGSILGPFWQTLTTAVLIGGLGTLYPEIFHISVADYLPMLATGLVFWMYLSGLINEGCLTFTEVHHIVHAVRLPFSTHVFRVVYRNILTLAHNFIIIPVVLLIFMQSVGWMNLLMFVAAFVLVTINGIWIGLLLGMLTARFRDIPPIVGSVVQLLMFVTPIFWRVDQVGDRAAWVQLSPLFAALDVMRSPLLGEYPSPHSWQIVLCVTVAGCTLTFWFFSRFRHRIPFWV